MFVSGIQSLSFRKKKPIYTKNALKDKGKHTKKIWTVFPQEEACALKLLRLHNSHNDEANCCMLEFGVGKEEVQAFVTNVVREHNMPEEHRDMIMAHVASR